MNNKLCVAWLSAGVSSFIAAFLAREHLDKAIYIDIKDQHPDSLRFIDDCKKFLPCDIEIIKSPYFDCVDDVCRSSKFIKSPYGARCTTVLKKNVRKTWEFEHSNYEITYVWGFDCNEINRSRRLVESMPQFKHEFPLIDMYISKDDCHYICNKLGIKRPIMYDMGYSNNNCIGCVKGGAGYWNKIKIDFPDVFKSRCKLERDLDIHILKDCFLDELSPDKGRNQDFIFGDCDIFCQIAFKDMLLD